MLELMERFKRDNERLVQKIFKNIDKIPETVQKKFKAVEENKKPETVYDYILSRGTEKVSPVHKQKAIEDVGLALRANQSGTQNIAKIPDPLIEEVFNTINMNKESDIFEIGFVRLHKGCLDAINHIQLHCKQEIECNKTPENQVKKTFLGIKAPKWLKF